MSSNIDFSDDWKLTIERSAREVKARFADSASEPLNLACIAYTIKVIAGTHIGTIFPVIFP